MYIFLDIDGVLNKSSQWKRMYSLDKECIESFCSFVLQVNGEIILTSSWRSGFVGTLSEDNTPQIKELEKQLGEYGVTIKGKTPILTGRTRDKEIERFLYLNAKDDNAARFIIIDDDKNEFSAVGVMNYFTDAAKGFSKKDVKGCLKLCNGKVK